MHAHLLSCDLLQLTMKDLTRICAADVANVGSDISRLRGFVDSSYAQFALLGVQLMWTTDVQSALEQASIVLRSALVVPHITRAK